MDKPKIGETWKVVESAATVVNGCKGVIVDNSMHPLFRSVPTEIEVFAIDFGEDLGVWLVTQAELERVV